MQVHGNLYLEAPPFQGVYIINAQVESSSGATCQELSYTKPTNLVTTITPSRAGGSITFRVTVFNNTDITYWYVGDTFVTDYHQNVLLGTVGGITITEKDHSGDSGSTFNTGDWIPPHTEREFYVTYTFGASAQQTAITMVNFRFDLHMDAVHDEFLAVLNTPSTYEELTGVFNTVYTQSGEVTVSTVTHPQLFASLFHDLIINVDGVQKEASVLVRRENIDKDSTSGDRYTGGGPSGCEYTLYITVDDPQTKTPVVYTIAYSCGTNALGDQWYQVGELYQGTAPIAADGSILYEQWIATPKSYEVADGITYKVGQSNGDQYDILKKIEDLIATGDTDIFNDIDNSRIFKKVYDILQRHRGSTDPAVLGLQTAFTNAAPFYQNLNNGAEFKVVRNTYTRAEVIPAIKRIHEALEYYYQAYPYA
jgi:hypothetical protein